MFNSGFWVFVEKYDDRDICSSGYANVHFESDLVPNCLFLHEFAQFPFKPFNNHLKEKGAYCERKFDLTQSICYSSSIEMSSQSLRYLL